VTQGDITLKKIGTAKNPADMLTKSIPVLKFKHYLNLIGVCSLWLPLGVMRILAVRLDEINPRWRFVE
jgi:hypothetical protein